MQKTGKNQQQQKSPGIEIDPYKYRQLIFDKEAKIVFSTNGATATGHSQAKKNKPQPKSHTLYKNGLEIDYKLKYKIIEKNEKIFRIQRQTNNFQTTPKS